jgi:hypothetical protein
MYNMLFGKNPDTKTILSALSLTELDVERFRDCWIDGKEDKIVIYTRTGGGNREDYPNSALVNHPLYLYDEDDDFDPTYAYYYFAIPEMREVQKDD